MINYADGNFLTWNLGVLGEPTSELTPLPFPLPLSLFTCRDSSLSPSSPPLCFIYSPRFTWDWWSSPLIVVITPVLLLQCIMHNRLTKRRKRGKARLLFIGPLMHAGRTLNRSLVKDRRRRLTPTREYLAPPADDWCVKTETRMTSCDASSFETWCRWSPSLLQYFESETFLVVMCRAEDDCDIQRCQVERCVVTQICHAGVNVVTLTPVMSRCSVRVCCNLAQMMLKVCRRLQLGAPCMQATILKSTKLACCCKLWTQHWHMTF